MERTREEVRIESYREVDYLAPRGATSARLVSTGRCNSVPILFTIDPPAPPLPLDAGGASNGEVVNYKLKVATHSLEIDM